MSTPPGRPVSTGFAVRTFSSITNAKPVLTGLPGGVDIYRQKTSGVAITAYQLVGSSVPAGSFTDTTADPVPGTPAVLPEASNRAAIGATGYYEFTPGGTPPAAANDSPVFSAGTP